MTEDMTKKIDPHPARHRKKLLKKTQASKDKAPKRCPSVIPDPPTRQNMWQELHTSIQLAMKWVSFSNYALGHPKGFTPMELSKIWSTCPTPPPAKQPLATTIPNFACPSGLMNFQADIARPPIKKSTPTPGPIINPILIAIALGRYGPHFAGATSEITFMMKARIAKARQNSKVCLGKASRPPDTKTPARTRYALP